MKTLAASLAAAALLAGTAAADQCAWIDAAQKAKFESLLAANLDGAKVLLTYCAPCGDASAAVVPLEPGKTFAFTDEGGGYSSFTYGTEALDAAYVYVPKEPAAPFDDARSLATLIGCEVSADTPKTIDVSAEGDVSVPNSGKPAIR